MATTLKFEIVTPEGTVYSDDVEMVTLPGVTGEMGVYPEHTRLMTQMIPGEIIVRKDGRDTFIASGEGLIAVGPKRVGVDGPGRRGRPDRRGAGGRGAAQSRGAAAGEAL